MNKKIGVAIMALVVTMSVGFTNVYADPASDKIKIQQIQTKKNNLVIKVELRTIKLKQLYLKSKLMKIIYQKYKKILNKTK